MSYWAKAPQDRGQLVLFATRLDDALPSGHTVRLLDEILGRLDGSAWEAAYHGRRGQPPIHPRVLAAVLLYGLLKRIRSSRGLEESLLARQSGLLPLEQLAFDGTRMRANNRRSGTRTPDELRAMRTALAEKFAELERRVTAAARAKYARRREVAERPFAVIKHQFGARRFLLRGLARVRIAWRWLTTAFNLDRLMSLLRSRAGPAAARSS